MAPSKKKSSEKTQLSTGLLFGGLLGLLAIAGLCTFAGTQLSDGNQNELAQLKLQNQQLLSQLNLQKSPSTLQPLSSSHLGLTSEQLAQLPLETQQLLTQLKLQDPSLQSLSSKPLGTTLTSEQLAQLQLTGLLPKQQLGTLPAGLETSKQQTLLQLLPLLQQLNVQKVELLEPEQTQKSSDLLVSYDSSESLDDSRLLRLPLSTGHTLLLTLAAK